LLDGRRPHRRRAAIDGHCPIGSGWWGNGRGAPTSFYRLPLHRRRCDRFRGHFTGSRCGRDRPPAKPHASDDERYEHSDQPGANVSRPAPGVWEPQCDRLEIVVKLEVVVYRLDGRLLRREVVYRTEFFVVFR
jgi:hypothetical protein